jgi:CRP/FNR family cyclic AMP-dependent transcriptional regulator
MSFTEFFDYPGTPSDGHDEEFVFLSTWTDEQWELLLAVTEARPFRAGEVVIREGDRERALYIVAKGVVEVVVGSGRRASMLPIEAGSLVGEMAFFDGRPRSATVRARTDGQLLRLSRDDFDLFAARHSDLARHVLFDLGRLLAARLRRTASVLRADALA